MIDKDEDIFLMTNLPEQGLLRFNKPIDTSITFFVKDHVEILKLCDDGTIKVRGVVVANDKDVVDGMREFIGYHVHNKGETTKLALSNVKKAALEFATNERKTGLNSSFERANGVRLFVEEVLDKMIEKA